MRFVCLTTGRQTLQESPQVFQITIGDFSERRVWEGGKIVLAVWTFPVPHGTEKICLRPVADASYFVGGNVGAVEGPERRFECSAACICHGTLGGHRVTTRATRGCRKILTAFRISRYRTAAKR